MQVDPIYIDDRAHRFWQWCITANFRMSLRNLRYEGLENIPTDGPVILSPNHCNCLNDALAVVAMDGRRKVFAARADIFHNPRVAKLLRFHRIMPIRRMRDGLDEVRKNDETIEEAVDTLLHDTLFCMLPEGRHRTMHSLLPLSKGIFRIAIETARRTDRPVYIVPMGLEYGDYFRLYDSLLVRVGEPINVSAYMAQHPEQTEPQQILALREELTRRMRRLILWVPDDERYEQNWAALRAAMPAPWSEMKPKLWPRWARVILLLLTSPLALWGLEMTIPYWLSALIIRWKVKDKAFCNSVQAAVQLILMVLSLGVGTLVWRATSEWIWHARHLDEK